MIVAIIVGVIVFIVSFFLLRVISRWLYNKGDVGELIHSLFVLVGTLITLILSIIMMKVDEDSLIVYTIWYAIVMFLTVFWLESTAEDDYQTVEWIEEDGEFDSSGHYHGSASKHSRVENEASLKNVLIGALVLAVIFTVVTYFLASTSFAWIPSALAVGFAVFYTGLIIRNIIF